MAKRKITIEVDVTDSQIDLLKRLDADNQEGFDDWTCDHSDEDDDDMYILCEQGLAESIVGEQFYITKLGKSFLKDK